MVRWELELSKEKWTIKGKSNVAGWQQLPLGEPYCLSEISLLKVGPREPGIEEVRTEEVSLREISARQIGPPQISLN